VRERHGDRAKAIVPKRSGRAPELFCPEKYRLSWHL